jgi:flavin-dependent dehydrogenase
MSGPPQMVDVLIVGGGPGGSTTATFLARAGLDVTVVEREPFPRFKVGESLVPNCMPILTRLGVLDKVKAHGFLDKFGVTFHDQEMDREATFTFREGRPWPHFTYDVHRAEFDQVLLDHAVREGARLVQPATVEKVTFDADGVSARVSDADGERMLRARFLVDASGRDGFLASRQGRREPMPGLGKVAIFAYFQGARRWPGREEGNVRIYIFPEGWFWYIPLTRDETSVGCVLHSRVVKAREGTPEDLFRAMVERCERVRENLAGARQVTPMYTAANFAYAVDPIVGDRFICVGDAVAFVDPIFSAGVFLAMAEGEMAAKEIVAAFRSGRFEAKRFGGYARRVRRGMRPFTRFITQFYDRQFLEIFMNPRDTFGLIDAVTFVLAGGAFHRIPPKMRFLIGLFWAIVRINRRIRRRQGRAESRLEY